MNDAQTYPIGNYQNTRTATTTAIAPPTKRVRPLDAKAKGCKRSAERQTKISTDSNVANGFLKSTFLPKLKETKTVQVGRKSDKTERDFFQSLSTLAEHYQIEPMQSKQFTYPYNMALAMSDMEEKLKQKVLDWEEIRLIEEKDKTYFTSEERYNTGQTLYYIPILPLYKLFKNKNRKQAVQLLQSVCSYLYHIVEIPYYRQQSTYLFWIYEMVTEWLISDEGNEEKPIYLSEIKQAEQLGDFMEQKIYNCHNLIRFKERLEHFEIKDQFDSDCFQLAEKIFSLYKQYPNENIFRNARVYKETDEDEQDEILSMNKYISFVSDAKGELFQSLFETVNAEFQECNVMEEPSIIKRFDGSTITNNNLDFENSLFPLIEELIYILNSF